MEDNEMQTQDQLSTVRHTQESGHAIDAEEMAGLAQGVADFRLGRYFEAHDAWEDVWRELSGRRRLFWQAMIQLAVGTHHWNNGNRRGCQSVWNKALDKCDALGQQYSTEVPAPLLYLMAVLSDCLVALAEAEDPLPLIADFATATLSDQWVNFG
jgi:Domain of unknown function (DUF309)